MSQADNNAAENAVATGWAVVQGLTNSFGPGWSANLDALATAIGESAQ